MKIERLPEIMLTAVVTLVGLLLAIYMGSTIGSGGGNRSLMIVGAMAAFAVTLTLKDRIWILIFLTAAIPGRLMFLPIQATAKEAGVMAAFAGFILLFAFKKIKTKPTYGFIDVVMLINLIYIALAFVRNPVGTLVMDTDRIGGRPYFTIFLAVCAYFVLSRATTSFKMMRFLPFAALAGSAVHATIAALNVFFPATVPLMARFYGGLDLTNYNADTKTNDQSESGATRLSFGRAFARSSFAALCSYFRPITLFNPMYPGRAFLTAIMVVLILISGFRSSVMDIVLVFLVASFYQRRMGEIVLSIGMGTMVICALVFMHGRMIDLPPNIQRSLSFLPGKWDAKTISDADTSKEWRIEMWKILLTEERYLKNKWFGDGFGYSLTDYQANLKNPTGAPEENQESFMITGEVHSGPVSAIRFMGYVGLALYLWLSIQTAVEWHRLIRRAYKTPLFPTILFFGVTPILAPFTFIFIFGAYETALAATVTSIGVLHFVRRGLLQYFETQRLEKESQMALPEKIRVSL